MDTLTEKYWAEGCRTNVLLLSVSQEGLIACTYMKVMHVPIEN